MKDHEALKKGLEKLGYKGIVKCVPCGINRDLIMLNGERLGIWDYQKGTFVD